jgi:hypothetical protein
MTRSLHSPEVDPIEEHRQLSTIDLRPVAGVGQVDLEPPFVQVPVPQDQASLLEAQDFCPVAATRDEHVEVPLELAAANLKTVGAGHVAAARKSLWPS